MAAFVLGRTFAGVPVKIDLVAAGRTGSGAAGKGVIRVIVLFAVGRAAGVIGNAILVVQGVFKVRDGAAVRGAEGLAGIVGRFTGITAEIPGPALLCAVAVEGADAVGGFPEAGLLVRAVIVLARDNELA